MSDTDRQGRRDYIDNVIKEVSPPQMAEQQPDPQSHPTQVSPQMSHQVYVSMLVIGTYMRVLRGVVSTNMITLFLIMWNVALTWPYVAVRIGLEGVWAFVLNIVAIAVFVNVGIGWAIFRYYRAWSETVKLLRFTDQQLSKLNG